MPNGAFPKIAGLLQDLDFRNFNLKNLKTLLFNQVVANTAAGAATIDFTQGAKQTVTLNANSTFTFTAPLGVANLLLKVVQDGTGSRTVTWPASVKWAGAAAPTLTTTAGATDIVSFFYDGTTYWGTYSLHFA